VARSGSGAAVG